MSDSANLLTQLSTSQAGKEQTVNELFASMSPVSLFGRRQSSSGLSWDYFGGRTKIAGVSTLLANGTVALTASATNYVEATTAGVVSKNTTAFTGGSIPLYKVVTGASTVTSYEDHRPWISLTAAAVGGIASTDDLPEGATNLYFTNGRALAAAPAETTTTEGALINGATAKTTPVDADYVGLMDSAASNILKKLSWANIKATLKTYFDTLYAPLSQPYDVGGFYPGVPTASAVVCLHVFNRAVTFSASLTGSHGAALVAATAQTDFDVLKNGTSFGTMRFAAAATTATFIAASSSSFAAGDVLKVLAPATPDATLANITFTLSGVR